MGDLHPRASWRGRACEGEGELKRERERVHVRVRGSVSCEGERERVRSLFNDCVAKRTKIT